MLAALVAASCGVVICVLKHHFTLEWTARSFREMTRHRCGEAMLVAVLWMVLETLNLAWWALRPPMSSRSVW